MLNDDNGMSYTEDHKQTVDAFNLRSILDKLMDHWPWILTCLIISLSCAFVVNWLSQPQYRAKTSVLVAEPKDVNNAVSELLYGQEFFGTMSLNLENEAYVLQSFENVQNTLIDLNLSVTYYKDQNLRKEELYQSSPIKVTVDESSFIYYQGLIRCRSLNADTFTLEVEHEGVTDIINIIKSFLKPNELQEQFENKRFKFGEELNFSGFRFKIDRLNSPAQKINLLFRIQDYNSMVNEYLSNLKIAPFSLEASILEISAVTTHPKKGCEFVNKLVEKYIIDELNRKNNTAERTIQFIDDQILLMGDSLSSVETDLETFKKSNTDLTISSDGSDYLAQSQRFEADRSQLMLNQRYLNELKGYIDQNNLNNIVIPSSIGISDQALNRSISDLVNLQMQIQAVESSKNPLVRTSRQKIEILKNSVIENIKSLEKSYSLALQNIDNQIGGMRTTLRNLPSAERQYIKIQRNYNLSEDLYLFLMQKRAEAGIAKASNAIDIRVINEARVPFKPISPKPLFNYAVAIMLGLTLPIGLILSMDLLNNKIRSKDELLKIAQIPYIGMIARNRSKYGLITNGQIRTEVAETFRTIRSNLRYMIGSNGTDESIAKTFLLTSTVSAEGKSFCANNLAIVFSNFGKKVLLIDADMRKDKNYEEFGLSEEIGLSDYLAGIAAETEIIRKTEIMNLFMVTSGGIPPNPSELLISGKFEKLLTFVKSKFDYVIIDTPPIGILSDGLELMEKCDVNIFIVRENYTMKKHLIDLNVLYGQRKMNNLALLYNAVNYDRSEYAGYGKYYNQYYGRKIKKSKQRVPIT